MCGFAPSMARSTSGLLYVLVFSAGALYFVYLGVFGPAVDHPLCHGVMMAAMVVMAAVMPSSAMPAMASTAMGAGDHMSMAGAGVSHAVGSGSPPAWVTAVCGLVAAGFLAAALWSVVLLIRGPRRPTPTC